MPRIQAVYVNSAVGDGSATARLMSYMARSEGENAESPLYSNG